MKKAIIISGPTASGKSSLALQMADWRDVAIINADALQIYSGLPILSAQPSAKEKNSVTHFLYSYFAPQESCSVGSWLKLVKSSIEAAWQQNKIPLIVGGSGMYITKLLDGISEIPEIDESIKINVRELYKKLGHEEFLQNLLKEEAAISQNLLSNKNLDKQRLIRAYEVLQQTKKPILWWQNQPVKKIFSEEVFVHINLNPDRENLYQNCNLRFEIMLQNGAIDEVQSLLNQQISDDAQITKTLGFVEIKDFLAQKITRQKMLEIATQKTRNYAKRQLTWFRTQVKNKNVFEDKKSAAEFLKNLK